MENTEICATLTGFSKREIKEMIEDMYGACVWEKLPDGSVVCYPTGHGKVCIVSEALKHSCKDVPNYGGVPF